MTPSAQTRLAWLSWLIAAMLFFSGTSGAGFVILLLLAAGFILNLIAIARWLVR